MKIRVAPVILEEFRKMKVSSQVFLEMICQIIFASYFGSDYCSHHLYWRADRGMSFKTWSSVQPISINNTALSVTSLQYNPFNSPSDWVDNLLGSRAHFIPDRHLVPYPSKYDEIRKLNMTPSISELNPECSFEILGYVRLDVQNPILRHNKELAPILGRARLIHRTERMHRWKCYWRVIFGHFEDMDYDLGDTFTSVVFFCPVPAHKQQKQMCDSLMKYYEFSAVNTYEIRMTIQDPNTKKQVEWVNRFRAWTRFEDKVGPPPEDILNENHQVNPQLAMCLSIPYTSSKPEKTIGNGALLAEFIRYYTTLGFKVFVYDRDGMNKIHLQNSPYMIARNITLDYVYYNYTIRGLLDKGTTGLRYDNELEVHQPVIREIQDWDKTLTNTHCRFEVKAVHQIENVMVADFDEFLYCPEAEASFASQKRNLHAMIRYLDRLKFAQISFPQRWIMNLTSSPRDCMIEYAKKGKSVFDCFGPYKYVAGGFNSKSLYLGHKCVATDFHYACSNGPYNHNCLCQFDTQHARCNMIHLSSQLERYMWSFSREDRVRAKYSKNELFLMTLGLSDKYNNVFRDLIPT